MKTERKSVYENFIYEIVNVRKTAIKKCDHDDLVTWRLFELAGSCVYVCVSVRIITGINVFFFFFSPYSLAPVNR